MNKKVGSALLLIISAAIWGFAFVAQTTGMRHIGPFTFSALRCFVGSLVMFLMMFVFPKINRIQKKKTSIIVDKAMTRKAGLINGFIVFCAMNIQQFGLQYTTPGKAGFITALYIVIIPIIKSFMGEKISIKMGICIVFATIGLYILSVKEDFSIAMGDIIVFLSAIFFSIHTLTLAHYSPKVDAMKLNAYQFFVCCILSFILVILFEDFNIIDIKNAMVSILYVGIMSTAVAFGLQIVALKNIDPTIAALISSVEAIFAVLGGFLILHQVLTRREIIGCSILFASIVISQIPKKFRSRL